MSTLTYARLVVAEADAGRFDASKTEELAREVIKLDALISRIQGALGTGEAGENLVAVARDAHAAEMELAAIKHKQEQE